MNSKHTPGPWFFGISGSPERGPVPFDYRAPGYYDNVGIFGADGEEVVGCSEYEVFRSPADARLIAAAPDLLAACEALADMVSDNYELLGYATVPRELDAAQTAITKAKGETS